MIIKTQHYGEVDANPARIACNDITLPGEYNPHRIKLFAIGNEYGLLGCVWAGYEQDALDALIDEGFGDAFLLTPEQEQEYIADGREEEIAYLGNAGEPADLSNAWITPIILTPDLVSLFQAARESGADTLFTTADEKGHN